MRRRGGLRPSDAVRPRDGSRTAQSHRLDVCTNDERACHVCRGAWRVCTRHARCDAPVDRPDRSPGSSIESARLGTAPRSPPSTARGEDVETRIEEDAPARRGGADRYTFFKSVQKSRTIRNTVYPISRTVLCTRRNVGTSRVSQPGTKRRARASPRPERHRPTVLATLVTAPDRPTRDGTRDCTFNRRDSCVSSRSSCARTRAALQPPLALEPIGAPHDAPRHQPPGPVGRQR
jgi:hypothetical protein